MRVNKKKLNKVEFVKAIIGTALVRKTGRDAGKPVGANEIHVFRPGKPGEPGTAEKDRVVLRGEEDE